MVAAITASHFAVGLILSNCFALFVNDESNDGSRLAHGPSHPSFDIEPDDPVKQRWNAVPTSNYGRLDE
jgi:hypothetical protein